MPSLAASAALSARPALSASATAGPDPVTLWAAYTAAADAAASAWQSHRMMRQAGGTDGTAGFLYQAAYVAQTAADEAYAAWQAASRIVFPGARG